MHKLEDRISRMEMFRRILVTVALRSTCLTSNAALILKDNRIISMGYNGSPRGQSHCLDSSCLKGPDGGCIRTIHAEQNSIAFAAKSGISTEGTVMWCTSSPCLACAKLIVNSGIIGFNYLRDYRLNDGLNLLRASGIVCIKLKQEDFN